MTEACQKAMSLLGRPVHDRELAAWLAELGGRIERDEYYASLEASSGGVELVFNEAPWVVPVYADPSELMLVGVHFTASDGAAFHASKRGRLHVGCSPDDAVRTLGPPTRQGDAPSPVLLPSAQPWLEWRSKTSVLRIEVNRKRVTLATISLPRREGAKPGELPIYDFRVS